MSSFKHFLIGTCLYACLWSCQESSESGKFKVLPSTTSGIDFSNNLIENDSLNYFTYAYMYMGGGVSVGDINNDGLPDIYFTGNMVPNRLYLNKGSMQFEDISEAAGVNGDNRWYTGTTMADVNADGFLDIYVSVSGKFGPRENQLFINNGDLTFSESAEEYGIADSGESIQATFWDYDKDGDLDMYLATYPSTSFSTPNSVYQLAMQKKDPAKSDKLFQMQEDGTFTDVTEASGILNFGLTVSASVADFNNDGWQDLYVSNDFSTPDFLYINNGDGTFSDQLKTATKQTAFYGMGTDAADINNDGLTDLIQVDMAPANNRRSKENMASMNPSLFWSTVNNGFHYQYMYNSFQVNRGIVDGIPRFSNLAWIGNVAMTDWSWCPLFADFDNDGWKDLFITNGTRKEINNRDFFKRVEKLSGKEQLDSALVLSNQIPEEPIDNYIYKNENGLFRQSNDDWSLKYVGFSNGAATADLDNDGDLDLIINNLDDESLVFENTNPSGPNYISVRLVGDEANPFGLSSKVTVYTSEGIQVQELLTSRGFQSSGPPQLHFGLASATVEKLEIQWSDGKLQEIPSVPINQLLVVDKETNKKIGANTERTPWFSEANHLLDTNFFHFENQYDDFYHQVLLPHKMSNFGPALAAADVNGDGLSDIFVGNGAGFSAQLYHQNELGAFEIGSHNLLEDQEYEDMDALFFDADGDGDDDLYVVSGGNAFPENSEKYQDRFYENVNGELLKKENVIPQFNVSGSKVIAHDYDKDGDQDLLVTGRLVPQQYPSPARSVLLENRSTKEEILFENVTSEKAPDLSRIGMITDVEWLDLDGDDRKEIVVVGEWMPITVFQWEGEKYVDRTDKFGFGNETGWWFSVAGADFDGDGDIDLVAGNLGKNYKYQANSEETFDLYVSDFDLNASTDLVLGYFSEGEQFPVRGRQCSSEQIPAIQVKFKDYHSFASATLEEIYGKKGLENAKHLQVRSFSSKYFRNEGEGSFTGVDLPVQAQYAPINDMIVRDINGDNHLDLIVAGNLYASEVETPRADAGIGLVLLGKGEGSFEALELSESGLFLDQDVKKLAWIEGNGRQLLIAASNQGPLQFFQINKSKGNSSPISTSFPR